MQTNVSVLRTSPVSDSVEVFYVSVICRLPITRVSVGYNSGLVSSVKYSPPSPYLGRQIFCD